MTEEFKDAARLFATAREYQVQQFDNAYTAPNNIANKQVLLDARILQDTSSKNQQSEKLKHKRIHPFCTFDLAGRKAVRLDSLGYCRIHPPIYVSYTSPYFDQPFDIL